MNKVIIIGNLSKEVELRYTKNGTAVATSSIAVNTRNGNNEEVCFIDITFFGKTAEIASQYLNKGSKILVEGRLKLEQWTDQNGTKRSKHSVTVEKVEFLDCKKKGNVNKNERSYDGYDEYYDESPF